MAVVNCSAFSEDGKYFVRCGVDGKLNVWETESGVLTQEYTPNLHLSSPCTCLTWVTTRNSPNSKKKKRRKSLENSTEVETLAMGTVSGRVLLYSVASSSVIEQLEGGHNYMVNHVAWTRGCNLFSCDAQCIVEWNIESRTVKSKWKAGTERLSCLLVLPNDKLLAAGNTIGLWDVPSRQLLKRYTGHASEVTSLTYVPGGDNYFISASKNDRLLCAWSLSSENKDNNSVASFVMEDVASSVSVRVDGATTMVAVTRSGVLHLYRHQLNGKCQKPLKPKVTVQIASDVSQNKEAVQPIPVIGAFLIGSDILIAHGSSVFLSFETISPNTDEKVMFLIRQDPRRDTLVRSDAELSKVKQPETSGAVEYISPTAAIVASSKKDKKLKTTIDVPMENRLDNLSLTREESRSHHPPHADSMAQLLTQGLYSQDKKILQSVLLNKDPSLVTNTVIRLSIHCVVPLVKELVAQIQRKTLMSQIAILWLKSVIKSHSGHLLANPEVGEILSPVLGLVETRLAVLAPMSRLRGHSDEGSGLEDAVVGSESDDHWEELSEMDAEEDDVDETEIEDVHMSS
ncbi:WD repeat-containing protein 43 [Blattella germanica]|nr:WD repeat-containing protein 43 [Blattella germanica]